MWYALAILSFVLLIIFWTKRNAVWGGFSFGIFIGFIISIIFAIIGKGFQLSVIVKGAIIGVMSGFISELIMKLSTRKLKRVSKSNKMPPMSNRLPNDGQFINEEDSRKLFTLLQGRITLHEVDFILQRTRNLFSITKDKSEERITWSIVKRADGKLTHDEAKIIYAFIIKNN
jgi:ABC-type uncharacterized transport system permease subunit